VKLLSLSSSRRCARLAALLALSFATGCQHLYALSQPSVRACPGELLSTSEMGTPFQARYRVRAQARKIDEHFTLITEFNGSRLILIAFNHFGAELFALTQQDLTLERESAVLPIFPIPPENLLHDLHRLRFLPSSPSTPSNPALPTQTTTIHSCKSTTTFVLISEKLL
jgi:hypothetical protein